MIICTSGGGLRNEYGNAPEHSERLDRSEPSVRRRAATRLDDPKVGAVRAPAGIATTTGAGERPRAECAVSSGHTPPQAAQTLSIAAVPCRRRRRSSPRARPCRRVGIKPSAPRLRAPPYPPRRGWCAEGATRLRSCRPRRSRHWCRSGRASRARRRRNEHGAGAAAMAARWEKPWVRGCPASLTARSRRGRASPERRRRHPNGVGWPASRTPPGGTRDLPHAKRCRRSR
mmetsp:Transcript_15663/g.44599  ORF Transcript_15663/g.44599 Transcript_15663/m.44599 type:complete len:230 (+) Transcript_15663:3-692(+)